MTIARFLSAIALALSTLPAFAAPAARPYDTGFYLGGAIGPAEFTNWCRTTTSVLVSCDDETSAWKLLGGYRFNRHIAIEATYIDWGKVTGSVISAGVPQNVFAEQTSMGIAALGSLPLTREISVFGKAGFLMTEQERRGAEAEDTEFHYGIGARFQFAPNWAARAEWEKTDKLKVEMLSIGVEYRF